jgi:hypothetical protein
MSLCNSLSLDTVKAPRGSVRYSVSYGEGGYLTKHTQDLKCRLDDRRNSKPCGDICSTSLELYDDLQRK